MLSVQLSDLRGFYTTCLSKTAWLNGLHGLSTWTQLLHIHTCITTLVIHYMLVQHMDFPRGKYVIRMHFSSVECSAGWCRATGFFFFWHPERERWESQRSERKCGWPQNRGSEPRETERLLSLGSLLWSVIFSVKSKTLPILQNIVRVPPPVGHAEKGRDGARLALFSRQMCLLVLWICIFEAKECKVQWILSESAPPSDLVVYTKSNGAYDEISGFLFLLLRSRCGLFLPLWLRVK